MLRGIDVTDTVLSGTYVTTAQWQHSFQMIIALPLPTRLTNSPDRLSTTHILLYVWDICRLT